METKNDDLNSSIIETTPAEEIVRSYSKINDDKRVDSVESIDKKSDAEYSSRPESRASSRMAKIIENTDNLFTNKPSSPITETQKSVDFILPPEEPKIKSSSEEPKIKPPSSPIYKVEQQEDCIIPKPNEIVNGFVESKINKNLELKNLKKFRSPSRSGYTS